MARSRKPLVAQNEVLARTLARQSKSQIAREMDIDRETVTRI
jgi:DNA-binding CsgD family transcriptional regulator